MEAKLELKRRGALETMANHMLLQSCDAMVATVSGFSRTAVQWGGLPTEFVRLSKRTPMPEDKVKLKCQPAKVLLFLRYR